MHEVPIIRDIFRTLEENYSDKLDRITKVQVAAGLLCNVQPVLLQNAFEVLIREEPRFSNIDLEVVLLPIIAYCAKCNREFGVERNKFVCECGTASNKIMQGEELLISKVEYIIDLIS